MIEKKAKTKWCPFARTPVLNKGIETGVSIAAGGSLNRCDGGWPKNTSCLGLDCACWVVWFDAKAEDLGRRSIAIETKGEYCALILKRCHQQQII